MVASTDALQREVQELREENAALLEAVSRTSRAAQQQPGREQQSLVACIASTKVKFGIRRVRHGNEAVRASLLRGHPGLSYCIASGLTSVQISNRSTIVDGLTTLMHERSLLVVMPAYCISLQTRHQQDRCI